MSGVIFFVYLYGSSVILIIYKTTTVKTKQLRKELNNTNAICRTQKGEPMITEVSLRNICQLGDAMHQEIEPMTV